MFGSEVERGRCGLYQVSMKRTIAWRTSPSVKAPAIQQLALRVAKKRSAVRYRKVSPSESIDDVTPILSTTSNARNVFAHGNTSANDAFGTGRRKASHQYCAIRRGVMDTAPQGRLRSGVAFELYEGLRKVAIVDIS